MAIPLLAIAAGLAIAGAASSAAASKGGVGKNTYRASNFANTPHYDWKRFEYGGPGGAGEAAGRYRSWADGAQGRTGAQADYTQANTWDQMGISARGGQGEIANMMHQRAQGLVPSIAQMQADRSMQQATAAQSSAQASARGAGGLALAQQNAANNTATMQSAISNQAQINAAIERQQAEQAAFGAYTGMRGGDAAQQQMAAQQAQYNAMLAQQQRQMNDQMSLGMTGYEHAVRGQQLNAGMGQQGLLAGQHMGAQGIQAGINAQNAEREMQFFKAGLGAVQGGASMATMGGGAGAGAGAGTAAGTGGGSDDRMKYGLAPLSDDAAKQKAYLLGRAHQNEFDVTGKAPGGGFEWDASSGGDIVDTHINPALMPRQMKTFQRGNPAKEGLAADMRDEAATHSRNALITGLVPGMQAFSPGHTLAGIDRMAQARKAEIESRGPVKTPRDFQTDDVTAQFAQGLAPIEFEYKPGMGPPGRRPGVRAQLAETQPITAPAITIGPDGLRRIDPAQGLSTALAGVGHLAQKQAEQDALLHHLAAGQGIRQPTSFARGR